MGRLLLSSTSVFSFLHMVLVVLLIGQYTEVMNMASGQQSIITSFVFGDSLVDSGNNNFIPSTARANYRPNGIDYPGGTPTGRFCNGKIIPDFISDHYNVPPIKPYLDPSNDERSLLRGANFASAGAGILNSTGRLFIVVITVEEQLELFEEYKQKVAGFIGEEAAEELVKGALYSVTFGGNDYINNFLMKRSRSHNIYTLQQWQDRLISTFKTQLTQLYNLGARKLLISAVGPIGCIPQQLNVFNSSEGKCVEHLQQMAINFNAALRPMLEELNNELPDAVFVYVNVFDIIMDYINNPTAYGFEVANTACCGQGRYKGFYVCTRFSNLCPDRGKYVFWDPFHPTQRVNFLIAQRIIDGPPSDISPYNVRQLLGF